MYNKKSRKPLKIRPSGFFYCFVIATDDETQTAEIASVFDCGRCLVTGLPKTIEVSSDEMLEALREPAERIADAVHTVLERTPPELVGDISRDGIVLTGGESLIYGLDTLLLKETAIAVCIAEDAASCVALGTGRVLESLDVLADSLTYCGKKYTS